MGNASVKETIEAATFEFTMGDHEKALGLLDQAISMDPECLDAWHARAEILFDLRRLDEAREAGQKALNLAPDDVHIHTSLSRIFMELGDKEQAEHHGAQARVLGWKAELSDDSDEDE